MGDLRRLLPAVALGSLALIWGASFMLIKVGVEAMSPTVLVLIRTLSGTLVLAAVLALIRSQPWLVLRRALLPMLVMAVLGTVLPFVAISWGELYIDSSLASILNATVPLWTAVIAYWATPTERPSPVNYAGVATGFVGIVVLVAPRVAVHGLSGSALGAIAVLLAAASYAAAALFQRRYLAGVGPLLGSLGQLVLATLLTLPLAIPSLPAAHLGGPPLLAVIALGVGGTGLAYVLYYYLLNSWGASRATTVTYLIPITAIVWGRTLLHEDVTAVTVAGMAVILLGVMLATRRAASPVEAGTTA